MAVDNQEFATGPAGELQLRGPNRGKTWPGSADMPTWNGLHVDPDAGLWVTRRDIIAVNLAQTVNAGGADVGPSQKYTWPLQQVTIHNGNAAQVMLLLLHYHWRWEVNVTAPAIADIHGSLTHDNATPSWRHINTNNGGTTFDWIGSYAETDVLTLAPGATTTKYIGVRALCGAAGKLDANSATLAIRGIGVTIG